MVDMISVLFSRKKRALFMKVKATEQSARDIMGTSFFGVEEAVRYFKVNPSKRQLGVLSEIPFPDTTLKSSKETHVLIAVFPLSIRDIMRRVDESLFYNDEYDDYARDGKEKFVEERGVTGWQLVRKTLVPASRDKMWSEQQSCLAKDEETPTARIMVYTIIGHYLLTGERLFNDKYARCSDIDSEGYRVNVGLFGLGYLDIGRNTGDFFCCYMGLASTLRP